MKVDRVVHDKTVHKIVEALDRALTLEENVQTKIITVITPDTPDTEFTVIHALNRIPKVFTAHCDSAAIVYSSRNTEWTAREMYLKCNQASVSATITVL